LAGNDPHRGHLLTVSAKKEKNKKRRNVIIISLIGVLCVGGFYFIWNNERSNQMTLGNLNTGCMYWANDHYEAMPCNEEPKSGLKLPMDIKKIKSFKRILKEDTITERSIGNVHYLRIDKRIEYYTAGGNHPVDVTRVLKPLTSYMFEKHLLKQENADKVP